MIFTAVEADSVHLIQNSAKAVLVLLATSDYHSPLNGFLVLKAMKVGKSNMKVPLSVNSVVSSSFQMVDYKQMDCQVATR